MSQLAQHVLRYQRNNMKIKKIIIPLLMVTTAFLSTKIYAQEILDSTTTIDSIKKLESKFFIDDLSDEVIQSEFDLASKELSNKGFVAKAGETFIIVDRGKKQLIMIVYADTEDDWELLKASHVSTGKGGRKEHFITPTGVFEVTPNILGYRALGTFNKNHIRGNGLKGYRVYDLGWQSTDDWRTKGHKIDIRMELHATDPANLEKRIGRADSEGCIRVPSSMNKLIDIYGILDKQTNEKAMNGSLAWKQLLGKDHKYSSIAGDKIVVIDSDK